MKSTSATTTSTWVSSWYFFLHPVLIYFETIFKRLKVVGSQIRFFHFTHIHVNLCGKVCLMFMTGHDVAMAGEFEFELWKEKKKLLVILRTAVVDILQMAKALLFMSGKENQPVKKLYLIIIIIIIAFIYTRWGNYCSIQADVAVSKHLNLSIIKTLITL